MPYFLSEKTIKEAYSDLSSLEVTSPGILHIFLILKGGGFNSKSLEPVVNISEKSYAPAYKLSSLFTPLESLPEKYDFISPLNMANWSDQSPSEPLKKWVSSRVKNNILGGATTWRPIIEDDPDGINIKFKHDYLNVIVRDHLGPKRLPIGALSIWANRFTQFDTRRTLRELIDLFVAEFRITDQEFKLLFDYSSKINPVYTNEMYSGSIIRGLIGAPSKITAAEWVQSPSAQSNNFLPETFKPSIIGRVPMNSELIYSILEEDRQAILSGPPGTSKSFFAQQIADKYFAGKSTKVQFHPKYSYQDFIGGYVVRGANVSYENGILLDLIKTCADNKEKHLLIIDEINRANVGQVFGETIQLLDRGNKIQIRVDGKLEEFTLPENLYILGTMNSSDRTLGAVDFAIRRRFSFAYCPPDPLLLSENCDSEVDISLADFLRHLNNRMVDVLKNPELVIGHTFFMPPNKKNGDKFFWSADDLCRLFNHKILPMIEEFCHGNQSQLVAILGDQLPRRLPKDEFISELQRFINE